MPYVQRNNTGTAIACFHRPQAGIAEEFIEDENHPDIVAVREEGEATLNPSEADQVARDVSENPTLRAMIAAIAKIAGKTPQEMVDLIKAEVDG